MRGCGNTKRSRFCVSKSERKGIEGRPSRRWTETSKKHVGNQLHSEKKPLSTKPLTYSTSPKNRTRDGKRSLQGSIPSESLLSHSYESAREPAYVDPLISTARDKSDRP